MSMRDELLRYIEIKFKIYNKYINKIIIVVMIILLSIIFIVIGVREFISFESKTTKIGFEDIGELATQVAYCTEISIMEDSRSLYGVSIPFTKSKVIYSYDVVIKAGFDFGDIEWKENDYRIIVKLPEVKVLSNEINLDSFKIYHEEESIFNKINMTENNEAMKELERKAEEDAIANGLLENARMNVETILKGFFGNVYDLDKYEVIFEEK